MLFPPDFLDRVRRAAARPAGVLAAEGEGGRGGAVGAGSEFADHRPYHPGDDPRGLDWNVLARHGRLAVKRFRRESGRQTWVLLDGSAGMAAGREGAMKWDAARRCAAAAACAALLTGDRAGAVVSGAPPREFPQRRGAAAAGELLQFLESAAAGGAAGCGELVDRFLAGRPRAGAAVMVSDFLSDEAVDAPLAALRAAGHAARAVRVYTADEERPADRGDLELVDAETGRTLIRRVTDIDAADHAARYRAFAEETARRCAAVGCAYQVVRADAGIESLIAVALS